MRKAKLWMIGLLILPVMFCISGCGSGGSSEADLVFNNGLVYTADGEGTTAEAVAVSGDEIVYVGDAAGAEEYIGNDTRVVDMDGGMLLPGFIDSHQHPFATTEELYTVPLYECETAQDYIKAVEQYARENPDAEKIVAIGFEKPIFDKISPTRKTLDKITSDIPIVMFDSGEHASLLNTKALEVIGFLDEDYKIAKGETVEKDKNGDPTGWVMDSNAAYNFTSAYDVDQIKQGLLSYQEMALSFGLTTTFEDAPANFENTVQAYNELAESGELKYRADMYMRIEPEDNIKESVAKLKEFRDANKEGIFKVDGAKIFIDGALEAGTAFMEEPYADDPDNYGMNMWEGKEKKLNKLCRALEEEDLNYHFHAIGDAAVSEALDAIEYAKQDADDSATRPGITHLQFVKEADKKRMADLDVTAAIQAFWAVYDEYYDQAAELLGKDRADKQYPIQSLFDQGVRVASGSDYPVQTDRPLEAIQEGITRAYPDVRESLPPDNEKATLEEMLQSYTLNGAIANYREDEIGSIETGKKADLLVLDKNLFDIDPTEIAGTKEMMTVFNGEVVYER